MELPNDVFILYSLINTKLRDEYSSIGALCASEGIDEADLRRRLLDAGFEYDPSGNQFK